MISVLTLTYQRHKILEEAIQSYLSQDFDDESEMVIINDSPDVEYIYDHPNVKIINCKERFSSISKKLEFGYKQCKYDYIYRLDDDDLLTPWALSLTKEYIVENPEYDVYRSDKHYDFIDNIFSKIYGNVNNGNTYTKKYLNRIKFPNISGYEDSIITFDNNARIINIDKGKYTMIYRWDSIWDGETYHISSIGKCENIEYLNFADKFISKNREIGVIFLNPSFKNDYYSQIWKKN